MQHIKHIADKVMHPHHQTTAPYAVDAHGRPVVAAPNEHVAAAGGPPHAHAHNGHVATGVDAHGNTVAEREVVNAPIVETSVRTDQVTEVQPVIHKHIERTIVHHVEKHIYEPAGAPAAGTTGTTRLAPVVVEHVHERHVEEVQPIIHREKAVQKVELREEHISEHVTAPTVHSHEVRGNVNL
eukprot:TRINITY_DN849_c0_g1_i1.p1 TRINITY_DN849_c0_g1~~TRINITY_DN849_c0_g1_i1.p1  ORF type:complete len:183 (+),score=70.85 TRINITY_DN849_c0_g1_i1:100-648(+)